MPIRKSNPKSIALNPELWVDQYGDYLYRFALSRVSDPSAAQDLVQETFLGALHARQRFQGRSSVKTWLISILKHKIVDHLRKKSREQPSDNLESFTDSTDNPFDGRGHWKVHPHKWTVNPMKIHEQKEFLGIFYGCLAKLPARLAKAFMLREVDGLSTEEICKDLNISASNTWVMIYRARMRLRRCLETDWLNPGSERKKNVPLDD
jgi:RNA polymerase sigma-70 factor (ECF subfamily)